MSYSVLIILYLFYYLVFIFVSSRVLFYYVCIAVLHTLVAGLLARSQYPEGPATGHLGTDFFFSPLCLKAKAEMVLRTPSCCCMLLMYPSRLKFLRSSFHIYVHAL